MREIIKNKKLLVCVGLFLIMGLGVFSNIVKKSASTNLRKNEFEYNQVSEGENSIDGTKELEIEVSDFEETNQLLKILGYIPKAYQENMRIRYMLNDVEMDIDTWPLIPTYMEIEGKTIEEVKQIEKLLGVEEKKITNLNCQDIYKKIYKIDIDKIKELKF